MTIITIEFTNTKSDQYVDGTLMQSSNNTAFIDYDQITVFNIRHPLNSFHILIRGGDGVGSTTVSPVEQISFTLTPTQYIALLSVINKISNSIVLKQTTIQSSCGALKEMLDGILRNK